MTKPIEFIILSDTIISGEIGNSRYMGAYTLASQLKQNDVGTMVIDYFTRHTDFFKYFSQFCSPDLKCVALSTTFLTIFKSTIESLSPERSYGISDYYKGELWFAEGSQLAEWLDQLRQTIKKFNPECKIIIGGAKAQFAIWRKEFYREIDYVCLGAADRAIVQFAKDLISEKPIKYREHGGVKVLDNSYDLDNKFCPHTEWVTEFAVQTGESLPIEIARGCVFNCKFCHYDKKQSFKKDLGVLKDELEMNFEKFGVTTYHFCDDCFNDHPKKVEDTCNLFQGLSFPIEWTAYARVDIPVKFPDTMDAMVKSGAKGLCFGLESFNHTVALKAGKGTPTEKVKEFLWEFKNKYSKDCLIEGSFIVGLPGETEKSQKETADWLCENPVLDFFSIGALGIMPYVTDFDKIVFDYAEYSRNPAAFGFTKIDFSKRYWEHETFNSTRASEMAVEIRLQWLKAQGPRSLHSMWLYTHLKSLGYSTTEIFKLARGYQGQSLFSMIQRFDLHLESYFKELLSANRVSQ